ncbi:MAG: hypothetical protein ABIY70_22110 [Capsulimonas sp.]|uniref:hypothetical protein n=1 Tax=Capsulimonas sp. TaxID=2494211 RepID=UPI003262DF74
MNDIAAIRKQILEAFADVAPPPPERLIAHQKGRFDDYTVEDRRYYLSEDLVGIIDDSQNDENEAIYLPIAIEPNEHSVYYQGVDANLEALAAILSREQVLAAAAFLGLILAANRSFEPFSVAREVFRAARAMRLCWSREGGPDADAFAEFDWKMRHFEYPVSPDPHIAALVDEIRLAFHDTPYPGDNNLSGSDQGSEAAEIALEFRGVDWRTIHPRLLECNYAATSFLTDEGLRYFIPAILIADLLGGIEGSNVEPASALTHYFTYPKTDADKAAYLQALETMPVSEDFAGGVTREQMIDILMQDYARRNETDWYAYGVNRMSGFSHSERKAIIHYLEYAAEQDEYEAPKIQEALERYWRPSVSSELDFSVFEEKK